VALFNKQISLVLLSALACLSGVLPPAFAEVQLQNTRVWKRANVISPGQKVWAFQAGSQNSSTRYATDGQVEPLGRQYAQVLRWKELVGAEESKAGQAELQNYMKANRLDDNDIAATSNYEVTRRETGFAMDWAYGLGENWMVGFQLPITYRETEVSTRIGMTPQLVNLASQPLKVSSVGTASSTPAMQEKLSQLAQQELSNSGYDNIPNQNNSWDWGDVSLLNQLELAETYRWTWAVQQLVRFPTARNNNLADYIQTSDDQGQVDLGLSSIVDYEVRRWLIGARLGYVMQMPDTVKMRVPSTDGGDDTISPEIKRDLGDWVWAAVDAELRVTRALDLNVEYGFLSKAKDRYSRDELNDQAAAQEIHQSRVGMQYRIGEVSTRSGIESKWVAAVGYTFPWQGRNSLDSSRTSVDVITYF